MQETTLLTEQAAAQYLGVTRRWMRRSRETRKVPFVKMGQLVRYRQEDLDRFIASRIVGAESGYDGQEAKVFERDQQPKRKLSPETKAKIAESQRKAWKRRRKASSRS